MHFTKCRSRLLRLQTFLSWETHLLTLPILNHAGHSIGNVALEACFSSHPHFYVSQDPSYVCPVVADRHLRSRVVSPLQAARQPVTKVSRCDIPVVQFLLSQVGFSHPLQCYELHLCHGLIFLCLILFLHCPSPPLVSVSQNPRSFCCQFLCCPPGSTRDVLVRCKRSPPPPQLSCPTHSPIPIPPRCAPAVARWGRGALGLPLGLCTTRAGWGQV